MKQLEIYSDHFNARKATLFSLYHDDCFTITRRIYKQASMDELITPYPVFSYVRQGTKLLFVDGKEFILTPGDLLYIPENSAVFSYLETNGTSFESINLTVQPPLSASFREPDRTPVFVRNATISRIFEELIEPEHISETRAVFIRHLLGLIERNCTREEAEQSDPGQKIIFDQLISQVAKSLYKGITLPEIALNCNMSLSTFKRHFELHFGLSPKDWIIRRRLETAYFEILVLKKSVSDAGYQNGFENLPHFSYSFKKYFGFSPSDLLNRNPKLN